jgi:hypothetical protein
MRTLQRDVVPRSWKEDLSGDLVLGGCLGTAALAYLPVISLFRFSGRKSSLRPTVRYPTKVAVS